MAEKTNAEKLLEFAKKKVKDCKTQAELHNLVFGSGGRFSQLFPTREERAKYMNSPAYKSVVNVIESLEEGEPKEKKSGKILLRLPTSLHQALELEADEEGISLNQLLLTKIAVSLKDSIRH